MSYEQKVSFCELSPEFSSFFLTSYTIFKFPKGDFSLISRFVTMDINHLSTFVTSQDQCLKLLIMIPRLVVMVSTQCVLSNDVVFFSDKNLIYEKYWSCEVPLGSCTLGLS